MSELYDLSTKHDLPEIPENPAYSVWGVWAHATLHKLDDTADSLDTEIKAHEKSIERYEEDVEWLTSQLSCGYLHIQKDDNSGKCIACGWNQQYWYEQWEKRNGFAPKDEE